MVACCGFTIQKFVVCPAVGMRQRHQQPGHGTLLLPVSLGVPKCWGLLVAELVAPVLARAGWSCCAVEVDLPEVMAGGALRPGSTETDPRIPAVPCSRSNVSQQCCTGNHKEGTPLHTSTPAQMPALASSRPRP